MQKSRIRSTIINPKYLRTLINGLSIIQAMYLTTVHEEGATTSCQLSKLSTCAYLRVSCRVENVVVSVRIFYLQSLQVYLSSYVVSGLVLRPQCSKLSPFFVQTSTVQQPTKVLANRTAMNNYQHQHVGLLENLKFKFVNQQIFRAQNNLQSLKAARWKIELLTILAQLLAICC